MNIARLGLAPASRGLGRRRGRAPARGRNRGTDEPNPNPNAVRFADDAVRQQQQPGLGGRDRNRHRSRERQSDRNRDRNGSASSGSGPGSEPDLDRGGRRRSRRLRNLGRMKRNPGLVMKLNFATELLQMLDLFYWAELCALYYMECSLIRFLLRLGPHCIHLSPQSERHPLISRASSVHVFFIFAPNIICILFHLFLAVPRGPDFYGGYQHGGAFIDFVGQMPPASRLYYLFADLLLVGVQCLMLAVHDDREALRKELKFPETKETAVRTVAMAPVPRSTEEMDAEERGVARRAPAALDEGADGVEMESLDRRADEPAAGRRSGSGSGSDSGSGSGRGSRSSPVPFDDTGGEARTHLFDLMASGNGLVGEYHILNTLWQAYSRSQVKGPVSTVTIGFRGTVRALALTQHHLPQHQPVFVDR